MRLNLPAYGFWPDFSQCNTAENTNVCSNTSQLSCFFFLFSLTFHCGLLVTCAVCPWDQSDPACSPFLVQSFHVLTPLPGCPGCPSERRQFVQRAAGPKEWGPRQKCSLLFPQLYPTQQSNLMKSCQLAHRRVSVEEATPLQPHLSFHFFSPSWKPFTLWTVQNLMV